LVLDEDSLLDEDSASPREAIAQAAQHSAATASQTIVIRAKIIRAKIMFTVYLRGFMSIPALGRFPSALIAGRPRSNKRPEIQPRPIMRR